MNRERKPFLLRVDPAVHDALARWASDEFRSLNAQIELVLRRALSDAGRLPKQAGPLPRRGRPSTCGIRADLMARRLCVAWARPTKWRPSAQDAEEGIDECI